MNKKTCGTCRYFTALLDTFGECRIRSSQCDSFPKRVTFNSCGEWADAAISPEQEDQHKLVQQLAVAITQGLYATFHMQRDIDDISRTIWEQARTIARHSSE